MQRERGDDGGGGGGGDEVRKRYTSLLSGKVDYDPQQKCWGRFLLQLCRLLRLCVYVGV